VRPLVLTGVAVIAVGAILAAFIHASGVRCVPWSAYGAAPVMLSGGVQTQKDQAQAAAYAAASREAAAPAPSDVEALADSNERFCTSAVATLGMQIMVVAIVALVLAFWFVRRTTVTH
jgi:hypothetical protein